MTVSSFRNDDVDERSTGRRYDSRPSDEFPATVQPPPPSLIKIQTANLFPKYALDSTRWGSHRFARRTMNQDCHRPDDVWYNSVITLENNIEMVLFHSNFSFDAFPYQQVSMFFALEYENKKKRTKKTRT